MESLTMEPPTPLVPESHTTIPRRLQAVQRSIAEVVRTKVRLRFDNHVFGCSQALLGATGAWNFFQLFDWASVDPEAEPGPRVEPSAIRSLDCRCCRCSVRARKDQCDSCGGLMWP